MKSRKIKRKKEKRSNILLKIVAILSVIGAIVFGISLFLIDMLPLKYLMIVYGVIIIVFIILLLLIFKNKGSKTIKVICLIFFLLFDFIFGMGIKHISKTVNFMDIINDKLLQKEDYYVVTLSSFNYNYLDDLIDKNIGVYKNINSDKAVAILSQKISFTSKYFTSVVDMMEELKSGKLDATLINSSMKNLFDTDLANMNLDLKELYNFSVTIGEVNTVKEVDVTATSFNIYIAGGDSYGSIDNVSNTDVNMVVSVDPVNKEILLTSIPRDYYINLPSYGTEAYDKLTHVGYFGIAESILAIENLLDININYYVKVNFSTVEKVVDAIGGIDVYSDYSFRENAFGEYYFVKGINHLNGREALAFSRERKSFADGDVQRVKNQQKVLETIIDKITSSTTLITNFSDILDSISDSFSTNMDSKSISKLVKMQLSDMSVWNIESQNLTGTDFYTTETYSYPGMNLYVMKRDDDSVLNATNKIKGFMGK